MKKGRIFDDCWGFKLTWWQRIWRWLFPIKVEFKKMTIPAFKSDKTWPDLRKNYGLMHYDVDIKKVLSEKEPPK